MQNLHIGLAKSQALGVEANEPVASPYNQMVQQLNAQQFAGGH